MSRFLRSKLMRAVAGTVANSSGGSAIPADGLIAHYTMDNINGTILVDEVGNYNADFFGSVSTGTGVLGASWSFHDGLRTQAILQALPDVLSTEIRAQSLFFKFNSLASHSVVDQFSDLAGLLGIRFSDDFYTEATNNNALPTLYSMGDFLFPTDGTWHHLIVEFNNSHIKVLIDNILIVDTATATINNAFSDQNSSITADYIDGEIDQFRIYDQTLNQTEVTALYNEGQ